MLEKNKCYGCGACEQACPNKCIKMEPGEDGCLYPEVNKKQCNSCGTCERVCPGLHANESSNPIEAYACKAIDDDLWYNSASGGVGSVIMEYILSQGGVVFGAAWASEWKVKHIFIETKEELYKIQKSKYLQSEIGNVYKQVKEFLIAGRIVLFTGTPCQIVGLKSFLRKEYDRLFTIDVFCVGAPMPLIFGEYVEELQNRKESKAVNCSFRNKELMEDVAEIWESNVNLKVSYEDGSYNYVLDNKDLYFTAFRSRLIDRPVCYNCGVRNLVSGSDIMIGDFWGIVDEHPNLCIVMKEHKAKWGISAVIIKTEKGKELFNKVLPRLEYEKSTLEKIERKNPRIKYQTSQHRNRDQFCKEYTNKNYNSIINLLRKHLEIPIMYNTLQQYKFGIWGSYNTRASLGKFIWDNNCLLAYQFSNSSIVSSMAPVVIFPGDIKLPVNPFRAEMLQADFNKIFIKEVLEKEKVDFFIIDFLEERFGIIQYGQSYITNSDALADTNIIMDQTLITTDIDNFWVLWKDACLKFINVLKMNYESHQIILVRMFLSEKVDDENEFINIDWIRRINYILEKCYEFFEMNLNGIHIIKIDEKKLSCSKDHKYGVHPEHLANKFYFEIADKVWGICKEEGKTWPKNNMG